MQYSLASNDCLLTLARNPIIGDIEQVISPTGTLFHVVCDYLDKNQISRRILKNADVLLNGAYIDWQQWKTLTVKAGDIISIYPYIRGGGGDKNPFATVLMLVVAVAGVAISAGALGGVLGASFAAGTWGATALGMGVMLGGSLLIGTLFPTSTPSFAQPPSYDDAKTYAIQNTQNSQRPYEALPVVIGKLRVAPDYAARPYTVIYKNEQYIYCLLMLSAGDVYSWDYCLGDTPISNYSGAKVIVHQNWRGEQLTWFDKLIKEEPENVALSKERGYVTRTTPLNTRAMVLMVAFPRGLVQINSDGSRIEQTVAFQVDYRVTGTSTWTTTASQQTVKQKTFDMRQIAGFQLIDNFVVYLNDDGTPALGKTSDNKYYKDIGLPAIASTDARIIAKIHEDHSNSSSGETSMSVTAKYYTGQISFSISDSFSDPLTTTVGAGTTSASGSFSKTAMTTSMQRVGFNFSFPGPGQYDVRIKRTTDDTPDNAGTDAILNESVLAGMQYHTTDKSIIYKGRSCTLIELQLKASDELSGSVSTFNCMAQSYGYVPNGAGGFTRKLSQNPAALALELMTSSNLNYRPIPWNRIDKEAWIDFYGFCAKYGWQYNYLHTDGGALGEKLMHILAAGMGGVNRNKSLYSVAWDDPNMPYVDMATPRTAWGFQIRKEFPTEKIDGLRIEFINEDKNYQVDERIVYADNINDSNAKNVQRWQQQGVTNSGLIWKHGRLRLAAIQLRPERITWNTDWRSIDYKRGQKIRVSYDVYMVGSGSGNVVDYILNDGGLCEAIVLNSFFDMIPGNAYIARDASKGTIKTWRLKTIEGNNNVAYFELPIPQNQAPKHMRVVSIGISDKDSMEVTIQSIEPMENFTAKITAIPSASNILDAISGPIPAWQSLITDPSYYQRGKPNPPYIQNVRSDETVLVRLPAGGFEPRIVVSFGLTIKTGVTVDTITAQIREKGAGEDWQSAGRVSGNECEISLSNVVQGRTYQIRLCAISVSGIASNWTEIEHKVIGMSSPPPDILTAYSEGEKIKIVYDAPTDFDGYQVLIAYSHNATVQQARPFSAGLFRSSPIDISGNLVGERTFFIYAVDVAGNKSANPAAVRYQREGAANGNVILSIDHKELGFPGIKDNCHVDANGNLVANETSFFWGDDSNLHFGGDEELYWKDSQYLQMVYTFGFDVPSDAQFVSSHFLNREIHGQIIAIEYNVGDHKKFWTTGDTSLFWEDDSNPFWPTDWELLPDYLHVDFAYMVIRISIAGGKTGGVISQLVSEFDVPDLDEIIENLSLDAAWNVIPLQQQYRMIKYADTIIFETPGLDPITINKRISGGRLELLPVAANGSPTQAVVNLIVRGY